MSKITEKQKREIVARLKNKESVPDIARVMKINYSTLWSHLKIQKQKNNLRKLPRKVASSFPWVTILGFGLIIALNVFILWARYYGK